MGAAKAPSPSLDAHLLTASEALCLIQAGDMTIEEYAQSLLRRIDERDSLVKAWAWLDREQLMEQARALDAVPLEQRSPIHGMPVAVKDVIYTKDMPTQFNSPAYKDDFPKVDAASIKYLRSAGALLMGKTATTEFAATADGPPTRNPNDLTRTPGGSSSGSGAAVGDFQAPVALGTQTGGSIIRPASFNGTYGFKPTWGAISREGQKFFSITYDTLGFFTRGVDDLQLLADVFGLQDDDGIHPPLQSVSGRRFAVFRTKMWPEAAQGTRDAVDGATEILRRHGATVEDVELPVQFDKLPEWYNVVLAVEGGNAFMPEQRANGQHLAPLLVGYANNTDGYTRRAYLEALDGMASLRPKIDALLSAYDAVLTPSVPDEAPVGMTTGSYIFCKIWTGLHVPVLNIPGFKGPNGMPIGLSLLAPRYKDRHLLNIAGPVGELFEAEGGWTRETQTKIVSNEHENRHANGTGH